MMTESELELGEAHEAEPRRLALPPPAPPPDGGRVSDAPRDPLLDRLIGVVETRPLASASAIFLMLTAMHLLVLNVAGVAQLLFVDDTFFVADGTVTVEILMLALIAYNIALPTLLSRACQKAFTELGPALGCDDRTFAQASQELANPVAVLRMVFGVFWAAILTPVFGGLLQGSIHGSADSVPLLTIWMYVRIALTFGLLGSTITYIAMLHYRFHAFTGEFVRVDLLNLAPLQPAADYARKVALLLVVLPALAGPAISKPEAGSSSATFLAIGMLMTAVGVTGAMLGVRRAIRQAKASALAELQAYSREIWRRAYTNGRIMEAVAIPAMAAMITVRNEIRRVSDWPGGRSVFLRLVLLTLIPVLSWFGGELVSRIAAMLQP